MTALPRQDQLFTVPDVATDTPDERPTANGERQQPTARPPKARESDGVVAIYLQARGTKYKYQGAKDADAWKRMRAVAEVAEIEARWRVGLIATGWLHVDTLAQLDAKWNELAPLVVKAPPSASADMHEGYDCLTCGARVTRHRFWLNKQWLCMPCFDVELKGDA